MLTRRRFLAITAAMGVCPADAMASATHIETGVALGARVSLRLSHPHAPRIAAGAMAEIRRLERVFSLYDPASSLSQLNAHASLDTPPPELLSCLSVAGAVHLASTGLFDPTVQPLWNAHAVAASHGDRLDEEGCLKALALTGWSRVRLGPEKITIAPGMALTLNGIAQGYIADRVAAFLSSQGLSSILIDTGELVALGGQPNSGLPWPVWLSQGGRVSLHDRAIATSAPLGMTFGNDRQSAHILDPRDGQPVPNRWRVVSVSSPSAAIADAVSTSACLMASRAEIDALCSEFPETKVESAIQPQKGTHR